MVAAFSYKELVFLGWIRSGRAMSFALSSAGLSAAG